MIRRLLILNYLTREFYQAKMKAYEKEYELVGKKKNIGGPPPYKKAIGKAGKLFIRLVLNNYYQEKITTSDLSDLLNINLKHMRKIERAVMGQSIEFGDYL